MSLLIFLIIKWVEHHCTKYSFLSNTESPWGWWAVSLIHSAQVYINLLGFVSVKLGIPSFSGQRTPWFFSLQWKGNLRQQKTISREYHPPLILFFFKIILFMNLFLAVLGLCCCAGFSLGAMCRLQGAWASVIAARGLSSCASQALEHRLRSCAAWT